MSLPAPAIPTRAHGGDSILRAVSYMCLAAILFPVLNASVKYLGQRYPMPELFWMRYAGHVCYCMIAFLPRWGLSLFATRRLGVQVMRSLLLFSASACYFVALRTIDLATASAIMCVGPIIVTALSVPMLHERVGPRRWTAVMLGFVGALIIIRPGFMVVQWGTILVLMDALFYGIYQILSRKIGGVDAAPVSITLTGVGGLVCASVILPFSDVRLPHAPLDILLLMTLGLWGLLGHFFVVKAVQWGRASIVAPMGYLELVGATLVGWLIFNNFPDELTWVGAAVIVASGLYIGYREHRLQRLRRQQTA
jgi:drug/metabolite transporter (DMT)-like permease